MSVLCSPPNKALPLCITIYQHEVSSFNRKNKQILFFFTFRYWMWSGDLLLTSWSESPADTAESCDLMRGDAPQAQRWPPSLCAALCLMFNYYYSMFSSLMTPLHPWRHVEIHTTLPDPKLSTIYSLTNIHLRALLFHLFLFIFLGRSIFANLVI